MKRAVLLAAPIGVAMMALGVAEFLDATPDAARRVDFAAFLVGADLAHDLVLAPLVTIVGALLVPRVARRFRAPVRFGVIASAVATLLALPGLAHTAADAHNPTVQSRDYVPALGVVLAVVWLITGGWLVLRARRGIDATGQTGSTG